METDALWKPRKKQTTFFPPFPQGLENLPQNVKFPTVPQPTANSIKPMKSSNSKRSDHVLVGPTVALPTRIRDIPFSSSHFSFERTATREGAKSWPEKHCGVLT